MGFLDFISRNKDKNQSLSEQVDKNRDSFWTKFTKVIVGKSVVDGEVLDRLEALLIGSDVSMAATLKIIAAIEKRIAQERYLNTAELDRVLQLEVEKILDISPAISTASDHSSPYVILVVGVNGVGKTTTIGKLAARFRQEGKKVVLGSADTFRAAAFEQLTIWGQRTGAEVVGSSVQRDPSSVAYEAILKGVENKVDVVIIDTAGRLHTKVCLMNELTKIKRALAKGCAHAPNEVLLVLDGTTGQNALLQAEVFAAALQVTGIVVTKLDGTSKGGVILGIVDQFSIPIKYVGIGEKMDDLTLFNARQFVSSLFKTW